MSTVALPQLTGERMFITDGGIETDLIFHQGLDLPCFAAFTLLADEHGTAAVREYYERYLEIARRYDVGMLLDTVTWRASPDWVSGSAIRPTSSTPPISAPCGWR